MGSWNSVLAQHGYLILVATVLLEAVGLPVPAALVLLIAGGAAARGLLQIPNAVGAALCAMLAGDTLMFLLGRYTGWWLLGILCRISLNPESCILRSADSFYRRGRTLLVIAKFIPGINTLAPPLAGSMNMRLATFLRLDLAGAALYTGSYFGVGFVFSGEIERIAEHALNLGGGLLVLLIGALVSYIAYKFIARQRFMRQLRIGRITVEELKNKIDAGEALVIVDLRHALDFEADPETIPGAFRMDAKELEEKNDRLPRDREVILYCT